MVILGLDPGIARLGYGVIERDKGAFRMLESGVLTTDAGEAPSRRLGVLFDALEDILDRIVIDRIALERLFAPRQANMARVSEVRGVILALAGKRGLPVEEISPTTLKALTTRSGSAQKIQMQKTVQRLLGLAVLPTPDAADALALALFASNTAHPKN